MVKIILKGLAGKSNISDRRKLDGIKCDDVFSEWFHKAYNFGGGETKINQQPLIDKGVKGGRMSFKWINNNLYVIIIYQSREILNDEEIEILKDYTQGQMSDGIGEGFEQYPCSYEDDKEIFLSPYYKGQVLSVQQIDI